VLGEVEETAVALEGARCNIGNIGVVAAAFEEVVVVVVVVVVIVIAVSGNKEAAASGVVIVAIELPCIIALDAMGVVGFAAALFILFSSLSSTRRMLLELLPLLVLTLSSG
jgi:hypothetical protein